jgi:hypothetical protein
VVAELRRAQFGKAADDARRRHPIGRQIIAAHHGKGRHALQPAALERQSEDAGGADRRVAVGEVVDDIGMFFVEPAGRRVVAIALLGDGQGDDTDLRRHHQPEQPLALLLGIEDGDDRADDFAIGARRVAHGERIEAVLRRQRVAGIGAPEARTDNAPFGRGAEQPVDVGGHMGAVESADPQVHDAGRDAAAIIGWPTHLFGQSIERRIAEPSDHERLRCGGSADHSEDGSAELGRASPKFAMRHFVSAISRACAVALLGSMARC